MSESTSHTSGDREFAVLQLLEQRENWQQREIARDSGMSVGLVNAVLKRLTARGLIVVSRVDARHMRYVLTPRGMSELTRRSYRFFRRTVSTARQYHDAVETLVGWANRSGYAGLELRGESDVAFLIESACERHGLEYCRRELQIDPGEVTRAGEPNGEMHAGDPDAPARAGVPDGRTHAGDANAPARAGGRPGGGTLVVQGEKGPRSGCPDEERLQGQCISLWPILEAAVKSAAFAGADEPVGEG